MTLLEHSSDLDVQ